MSLPDARALARAVGVLLAAFSPVLAAPQLARPRALTDTIASPTYLPPLDLDGDGDADVLIAAGKRATLHRFENLGNGRFGRVEVIGDLPASRALWTFSDVDADGDIDAVAVTIEPAKVFVMLNRGDGVFMTPLRTAAFPGHAIDIRIGDIDGNGLDDIVVTTDAAFIAGKGVFTLRRIGNNVFLPPMRMTPTAGSLQASITGPTRLADLDGDNDLDLIVTDTATQTIHWFRNQGAGFAWGPVTIQERFRAVHDVVAADVDGDGDRDLVVAAESATPTSTYEVTWYHNNGHGTFASGTLVDSSAAGGTSLCLADLDGDNDLDIIATRAAGAAPVWFDNDGTGPRPGARELPLPDGWDVTRAAAVDLDGDGVLDVLYVCATQQVGWCRGSGSGTGSVAFRIPQELTSRTESARDSTTTDLDLDGDLDVLVAESRTGTIAFLENRRSEGFARPVCVLDGLGRTEKIEAGDLDGDGDDDLVAASFEQGWIVWSENDAGSLLVPRPLATIPPSPRGTLQLADIDSDQDLDVIVTVDGVPGVTWFEQTPAGLSPVPRVALAGLTGILDLVVSDLEGDGRTDLVVTATSTTGSIGWHRGLGGGALAPRIAIPTINNIPASLVVLDADGDGDLDLAAGAKGLIFLILEWIPQIAPGQFGASDYVGSSVLGWPHLIAADVDLDGDDDLIATPSSSYDAPTEVAIYRAPFGAVPHSTHWLLGVSSISVADIDADGDIDLLVTSEAGASVDIMRGTRSAYVGTSGCTAVENSTGTNAKLDAVGTEDVAVNTLRLQVYDLPRHSFTVLLTSRQPGFVVSPGSSAGTMCLSGAIGRFVDVGQVRSSGGFGLVDLDLDLAEIPQPLGRVQALAGETWHFQAWYRDAAGGQGTSNFSDSIAIEFR